MRMVTQEWQRWHLCRQFISIIKPSDPQKYSRHYQEHGIKAVLTAAKDIHLRHPKS